MMNGFSKRQTSLMLAIAMATVIGIALAFFILALPVHLLEALVSATQLPTVLSIAAPPLGDTARILLALATALAGAIAVAAIFLRFDRPAATPVARLPLRASEDLAHAPEPATPADDPVADLPNFSFVPAPETKPVAEAAPKKEGERFYFDLAAIRAVSAAANDEPLDLGSWPRIEERGEALPEPVPTAEPDILAATIAATPFPIRPMNKTLEEALSAQPIGVLMQRLEAGLQARMETGVSEEEGPAIDAISPRLRSTLDELRKMAGQR